MTSLKWILFVSASPFISFPLFSPLPSLFTFCIYLSASVCLIYFPSPSSFFSLSGTLSFSFCLCLHLLITHSLSSSVTLSGPPPSHPSSSFCPSHHCLSSRNPLFIQCFFKWNTTPSTVSLCMMHPSHTCPIPPALIYHPCPLCLSFRTDSHPRVTLSLSLPFYRLTCICIICSVVQNAVLLLSWELHIGLRTFPFMPFTLCWVLGCFCSHIFCMHLLLELLWPWHPIILTH